MYVMLENNVDILL